MNETFHIYCIINFLLTIFIRLILEGDWNAGSYIENQHSE